jgi:hypothetical protein
MNDKELNEKMIAAGMIPLNDLLCGSPLDGFVAHKGVDCLEKFEQWLNMRHEGFLRMAIKMELNKGANDDMFEWVLSHRAAFNEVLVNFRAAKASGK